MNNLNKLKRWLLYGKLVKCYTDFDLITSAFDPGDEYVYILDNIDIFRKKYVFDISIAKNNEDGYVDCERITIVVPYNEGDEKIPFFVDGKEFYWDVLNKSVFWNITKEATATEKINNWVDYSDNGELRVEKEYADHNLSKDALSYAYKFENGYYSWNVLDYSYSPVVYEIPAVFKGYSGGGSPLDPEVMNVITNLSYAEDYFSKQNINATNYIDVWDNNKDKKLWEPEGENKNA